MKMIQCSICNTIERDEDIRIKFKFSTGEYECRMQLLGFPNTEEDLCTKCLYLFIKKHFEEKIKKLYPPPYK